MKSRLDISVLTLTLVLALYSRAANAVDGVILIDQTRALAGGVTPGDAPGFPVSITTSGSFRLSGDLTVPPDTAGIDVSGSYVTIDLNGFQIQGGGGTGGDGIHHTVNSGQITVKNGTIRGMGGNGILADNNPARAIISDVRVVGNHGSGISVDGTAVITGCTIFFNDSYGIFMLGGFPATITGNLIRGNGTGVVPAREGAFVRRGLFAGNTVLDNGSYGASLSGPGVGEPDVSFYGNVFDGNNGGNANPQIVGGENLGSNQCGTALCP